ncbi:alpha-glucosidase [Leptospira saintgironsiae]|uniref:Alpha-glucosidase n=1 Tax=Leptospira saintgironsiae TaxID=2023183 RepID=A0A2M9Y885_9LEPT|nr:alpha-glucosidase [Leptospira saintgironsiae]PJZ47788.1 alpha-glucosidase [Leptospira saintgironsiae]
MRFFFIISILFAFLLDCGSRFEKISPFSIPPQEFDLGNGVKAVFLPTELSFITSKGRILEFSVQDPFLSSAKGEQIVNYRKATFKIKDKILLECGSQTIESLGLESGALILKGKLTGKNCETSYSIRFVSSSNSGLDWKVEISNPELNRTFIKFKSDERESIYGLGEQFSHLNLKGKKPFLFSEEQGVGRGDQPITWGAELLEGAGGNEYSTYTPIPFFLTSRNRAFFFENSSYSVFDFEEDSEIAIEFRERGLNVKSWKAANPKEILKQYTSHTGRFPNLPDWAYGTWLGIQGGKSVVLEKIEEAKQAGNPISALWIQDWVGQRKTVFGSQLWWKWFPDETRYPDFKNFVKELNQKNIQVLGYINPMLATEGPLFEDAVKNNYLVKDKEGKDYIVQTAGFPAGLLDLTNPKTRTWIKNIIKQNLIGNGLSGWMADFGEWLPTDAVLFSKESAEIYHNRYPVEWARLNREAIQEAGKEGQIVFFTRAGYSYSNKYSTSFWAGDQMVSWGRHDGIVSSLIGILSGGMSGLSLNHSDIGGYTTIPSPIKDYFRSKELFLRWSELNVFTPVFRTHEGNRPGKNHQPYSDPDTIKEFARYGQMHLALKEYFKFLNKEASESGLPVLRPLYLSYPEDNSTRDLQNQFLLGEDLLVIPVLEKGEDTVKGYLPKGEWEHVWTGKTFQGGVWIETSAPIGSPAIFLKKKGIWYEKLKSALSTFKKN